MSLEDLTRESWATQGGYARLATITSVMCGCPLRVKVFERDGDTESTGAVMCPASDAAGMAAGPDELRGASA